MNDIEILATAINEIDRISVPLAYAEQIASPLINVNNMLKHLYSVLTTPPQDHPEPDAPAELHDDEPTEDVAPYDPEQTPDDDEEFT